MWTTYFEAATQAIRHDFVWRNRSAEKGIRRSLGALWERSGRLPQEAYHSRPSPRVSGQVGRLGGGLDQALITLPGLAVCWSSSYTRSKTSRVHSPPRVTATGADTPGAMRDERRCDPMRVNLSNRTSRSVLRVSSKETPMSQAEAFDQHSCTTSRFTRSKIPFPSGTTATARPTELLTIHARREEIREK